MLTFVLLSLAASAYASFPAPGDAVIFRNGFIANGPCISNNGVFDGAEIDASECITSNADQIWTAVAGIGAANSPGPTGPIQIHGKCLDVTDGVDADGTKLQLWTCVDGDANQQFNINSNFTISWAGHNKCVDLTNGDPESGTRLQIWDCDSGNPNQIWIPQDPGTPPTFKIPNGGVVEFSITSTDPVPLPQGCLTANDTSDGSPIVFDTCNDNKFFLQEWAVIEGSTSIEGPIRVLHGLCLDVTDGVNADGTLVQAWTCTDNNPNQMWQVDDHGSIRWFRSNKCIDLTNGIHEAGNKIQIWTCGQGNPNQNWTPTPSAF